MIIQINENGTSVCLSDGSDESLSLQLSFEYPDAIAGVNITGYDLALRVTRESFGRTEQDYIIVQNKSYIFDPQPTGTVFTISPVFIKEGEIEIRCTGVVIALGNPNTTGSFSLPDGQDTRDAAIRGAFSRAEVQDDTIIFYNFSGQEVARAKISELSTKADVENTALVGSVTIEPKALLENANLTLNNDGFGMLFNLSVPQKPASSLGAVARIHVNETFDYTYCDLDIDPQNGEIAITQGSELTSESTSGVVYSSLHPQTQAGTYTGNGAATRKITLPKTPSFVQVLYLGVYSLNGASVCGGIAINGTPAKTTGTAKVVEIVDGGFKVFSGANVSSNANGLSYTYIWG